MNDGRDERMRANHVYEQAYSAYSGHPTDLLLSARALESPIALSGEEIAQKKALNALLRERRGDTIEKLVQEGAELILSKDMSSRLLKVTSLRMRIYDKNGEADAEMADAMRMLGRMLYERLLSEGSLSEKQITYYADIFYSSRKADSGLIVCTELPNNVVQFDREAYPVDLNDWNGGVSN